LAAAATAVAVSVVGAACGTPSEERVGRTSSASTVGGCTCVTSGTCSDETFSNVPADGAYYITTFGGGADTQPMACGGTADGTWAYVADEARFGCGAKLQISANGKSCIAQVADCGPNRCVELAAANDGCANNYPIIDASPFITQYLFGTTSSGWSDHTAVTAVLVDSSTAIGCPGGPVNTPPDAGPSSSSSGSGSGSSSGSGGSSGGGSDGGGTGGSSGGGGTGSSGGGSGGTSSGSSGAGSSSGSSGGVASSSGSAGDDGGNGSSPSSSDFGQTGSGAGCSAGGDGHADTVLVLAIATMTLAGISRRRRSRPTP
jgi:hypothetical protein